MSRLVVDKQNQLREINTVVENKFNKGFIIFAKIISFIFHPVFIPVYITLFLINVHAYAFSGINSWGKFANLVQVIVNCTFLPLAAVFLLRRLKFIDSVMLKTQKDRIIPYVICMIFYFWNWYVFKNNFAVNEMIVLTLAIFIACILGFLMNISMKISMHAIAMGIGVGFFGWLALIDSGSFTVYLSVVLIITGLVCTARLMISDHSPVEIYFGIILGSISLILATVFN